MQPISSPVLRHIGFVDLPEHRASGAFDHAAVHAASGHVYVAHTANNALDVFDPVSQRHLYSVPQLPGVAGVLVSDEAQLIISSNRAENTIGIFPPGPDPQVSKIAVGVRPNGLAYDHVRGQILVANVGTRPYRAHTRSPSSQSMREQPEPRSRWLAGPAGRSSIPRRSFFM
jgi:hypothetical protein